MGVHPDHRRKDARAPCLRHFEQVHEEQGTHVSALHASEPAIYGRHGYGLASQELQVSLGRGTTLTAPGTAAADAVTTRLATVTDRRAEADAGVPSRRCRPRLRRRRSGY